LIVETTETKRFQVTVSRWDEGADGKMILEPTKDISVFPMMLTLKAGEQRNLRAGALTAFAATEKTYRLFVEELPPVERPSQPQIRVLTRVGVPIFLQPSKMEARAQVRGLMVKPGGVTFVLANTGTVHIRPTEVRLKGFDAKGESRIDHALQAWYVLAGGERRYEQPLSKEACRSVRKLTVTVTSPQHTFSETLDTPKGACGS
jgi:fimbrial chaperone protein